MIGSFFFNESFEILADTDTLDLDPRSFSSRIEIVEFDLQNNQDKEKSTDELINSEKKSEFEETLQEYSISDDYGKPVTFTNETYNKFKLSKQKPGKGGEIHITDAIQSLINENNKFIAHNFSGKYLDCGSMNGYIKSTLEIAKSWGYVW